MHFVAKVIILDEPTNNLGVEETHGVLRFVKEVRDAGHSVLFITHNMHHVFQVADRIVVMRRGEITAELAVADTDLLTVESIITGAKVSELMAAAKARSFRPARDPEEGAFRRRPENPPRNRPGDESAPIDPAAAFPKDRKSVPLDVGSNRPHESSGNQPRDSGFP